MARIRTIKPEFWTHEALSELPPEVHMLAAAILNYADDHGYFNANPKLVKAACCPLREDATGIDQALGMLVGIGYLELGEEGSGRRYGRVLNFRTHQKVNRPTVSKIANQTITWGTLTEPSVSSHGAITEGSLEEQGTGNREQGTGEGLTAHVGLTPDDPVERLFEHWKTTHRHPKARLDPKRRKLIRTALKHYPEEVLCQAITGYRNSPHHMGENDTGTVFDSIELILRDSKHIDAGVRFFDEPPRRPPTRPRGNGRKKTFDEIFPKEPDDDP